MGSSARCSNLGRKNPILCLFSLHMQCCSFSWQEMLEQSSLCHRWGEGTSPCHLLCKAQSSTKQRSFTGGHPQTDKETLASLSLLWLSLLIIPLTVLSVGEILFLAGAATLLSQKDFIYLQFVSTELPHAWGGRQGKPDREEISTLSRSAAWCERHVRFGCLWYSWHWTAARPPCFKSKLLAGRGEHGPCPEGRAAILQCCSRAQLWKPVCLCGGMTGPHCAIVGFLFPAAFTLHLFPW